jgi:hypothetical protein
MMSASATARRPKKPPGGHEVQLHLGRVDAHHLGRDLLVEVGIWWPAQTSSVSPSIRATASSGSIAAWAR